MSTQDPARAAAEAYADSQSVRGLGSHKYASADFLAGVEWLRKHLAESAPEDGVREWQIEKNRSESHALISGPDTIGSWGQLVRVRVVDKVSYARLQHRIAADAKLIACLQSALATAGRRLGELESANYAQVLVELEQENTRLRKALERVDGCLQVYRSQGCDGPWSDLENLTIKMVDKIEKEYAGASRMTPWLWFNQGWDHCRKHIREALK